VLQCTRPNVGWINKVLHTTKSGNLQRISLELPPPNPVLNGAAHLEMIRQEWADLDHVLVQFWVSRSLRPKVIYEPGTEEDELMDRVARLLPELTKRGIIDLVEYR